MERDIYAIVMAAGRGTRFGGEVPKQFVDLAGKPVIMHAINTLRQWKPDVKIVVALNPEDSDIWSAIAARYDLHDVAIVAGGATRWGSVRNALATLTPGVDDVVMVHDGARPLLTCDMLDRLMAGLVGHSGVIPVVALTDSIRRLTVDGSEAVDRSHYCAVQTPQAFNARKLQAAYHRPYQESFTDDASVMAASGYDDLALVEGDVRNIKITNPRDVAIANVYLNNSTDE